jgi:hypothetical protein
MGMCCKGENKQGQYRPWECVAYVYHWSFVTAKKKDLKPNFHTISPGF